MNTFSYANNSYTRNWTAFGQIPRVCYIELTRSQYHTRLVQQWSVENQLTCFYTVAFTIILIVKIGSYNFQI